MAQRTHRVVVPGVPVVDHAVAGKLVILGLDFVILGAVDQVHDLVDVAVRGAPKQFSLVRFEDFGWNLFQKSREGHADALDLFEVIVLARVLLEYWISFCRDVPSLRSLGKSPRALHRSTWKASVSWRVSPDTTHCSGVFETSPPSQ